MVYYISSMGNTILIVTDDFLIRHELTTLLSHNDFILHTASYGAETLHALAKSTVDLVIIDQVSITSRAKSTYAEIMKKYPNLPLISIVSSGTSNTMASRIDPEEQVTLPLTSEELTKRIESLIEKRNHTEILQVADLTINSRTLHAMRKDNEISLTPQEFKLLHYLMLNKGRIMTREMILQRIWQYSSDIETRVVDVYMGYLRKKIDKGSDKKLLYSVRGFGYVIKE